jgi:hypothetical protein
MGLLNEMTAGLSEGEVQQFKEAVKTGANLIFDKNVFHGIHDAGEGTHPEALATTLVMVLNKVEEQVGELPVPAVLAAGLVLLYDVADALTQAGEEVSEEETMQALSYAVQMWLQQHPNRADQNELAKMAQPEPMTEPGLLGDPAELKRAL